MNARIERICNKLQLNIPLNIVRIEENIKSRKGKIIDAIILVYLCQHFKKENNLYTYCKILCIPNKYISKALDMFPNQYDNDPFIYISKIFKGNECNEIMNSTRKLILFCTNENILTSYNHKIIGTVCLYTVLISLNYTIDVPIFEETYNISIVKLQSLYSLLLVQFNTKNKK